MVKLKSTRSMPRREAKNELSLPPSAEPTPALRTWSSTTAITMIASTTCAA